jgi:hypothetical protein
MLRILRYLATVRRARSIPWTFSLSTISSSLRGFLLVFAVDDGLELFLDGVPAHVLAFGVLVVPPEKNLRRGKTPRGV